MLWAWVLFPGVGLVVLVDDDSFERVCGRWLSCAFLWVWAALVAAWHLGCLRVLGWVFVCDFGVFRVCLGGRDNGGGGFDDCGVVAFSCGAAVFGCLCDMLAGSVSCGVDII